MKEKALFENLNYCSNCKRPLPKTYIQELCPACQGQVLFAKVREYIRENDVNEHQVAEHFDIPVSVVREWIKEGRIEYKVSPDQKITGLFCQKCGAPVTFGNLCTACMRAESGQGRGFAVGGQSQGNNKMRFLDGTDTNIKL